MIRNERDILNVVTSKAPEVANRPAGGLGAWGVVSARPGEKNVIKMKKKYNPPVDHRCRDPRTF